MTSGGLRLVTAQPRSVDRLGDAVLELARRAREAELAGEWTAALALAAGAAAIVAARLLPPKASRAA
jgi:hypothetical protein